MKMVGEILNAYRETQDMGDEVEMASHLKSQATCRTQLTPHESTVAMEAAFPKHASPYAC